MTDSPTATLLEQAREWGIFLASRAPWASVVDRASLFLVDPAPPLEDRTPSRARFWMTLDDEGIRAVDAKAREPLNRAMAVVDRVRAADGRPDLELVVLNDDGLHQLLQGTNRPAMEARWRVSHMTPIADRQHRGDQYALRAGLVPDDAPERVTRQLWLDAVSACDGLPALLDETLSGVPAAGEAVAAVARIACFTESGRYPPVAYLDTACRETRIGRRVRTWLDDAPRATGGDEGASKRLVASGGQVLEEIRTVLGELYRDRPWLRTPEAFLLRAPR